MGKVIGIAITMLTLTGVLCQERGNNLKTVTEWKDLDYVFPTPELRQAAINDGHFVAGNGAPIDVDVYYGGQANSKVFITVPRFQTGVPVTLGTVSTKAGQTGAIIDPYPDYSWHASHGQNCDGITSVFRISIDQCGRLWVLDTGRIGDTQHCQPQLLVFNLESSALVHRYRFPTTQYRSGTSLFVTPIVDVRDASGTCMNTMVYVADVSGFAILVYSYSLNTSWRVQNKLIFPDPRYGTYTISGESFDLMDGVLGMAISNPYGPSVNSRFTGFFGSNYLGGSQPVTQMDRLLYFHSLAGGSENVIPLRYLNNQTIWDTNQESIPRAFIEIGSRGIQSAAEAMDRNGNLFFGLMSPNAIACWDSNLPYKPANMKIVAQSEMKLQFASGLKIIKNKRGKEELWVLTCRFQKIMTGTIDYNEPNFRIQALPIEELLGGTKCVPGGFSLPFTFANN